jgi:uncharacterized membrane protein
MNKGRWWRRVAVVLGVAVLAIQLVPVDRTNPPVEEEVPASPEVREILRRACYDCHSHETEWPWYSRVAPVSWLVARDVEEAREHLNFSTWNRLSAEDRAEGFEEAWEEVESGEMPLWFYVPLHPEAELTAEERSLLRAWSVAQERAVGGRATVDR